MGGRSHPVNPGSVRRPLVGLGSPKRKYRPVGASGWIAAAEGREAGRGGEETHRQHGLDGQISPPAVGRQARRSAPEKGAAAGADFRHPLPRGRVVGSDKERTSAAESVPQKRDRDFHTLINSFLQSFN